jgi:serine protease
MRGTANVGIIDSGFDDGVDTDITGHISDDETATRELVGQVAKHRVLWFVGLDQIREYTDPGEHGTFVTGIIAAKPYNIEEPLNGGVAGGCFSCNILFRNPPVDHDRHPLLQQSLAEAGAQVINFSAALTREDDRTALPSGVPCDAQLPAGQMYHAVCVSLKLLAQRDINFVASAGNYLNRVHFPAREPSVIAVGGIDSLKNRWDERNYAPEAWDRGDGCPALEEPGTSLAQCGSNFGPELDFVAAARKVVSTYIDFDQIVGIGCGDEQIGAPNDGLGECTGTSFSAPHVTAAAALLRSANPLIGWQDTYEALRKSTGRTTRTDLLGWGEPNTFVARNLVLGKVAGQVLSNRVTPMFALRNNGGADTVYTTKPQVAVAAYLGELYTKFAFLTEAGHAATQRIYGNAPNSWLGIKPLATYPRFPASRATPRASFYVFTGPESPYPNVPLKPLYRLLSPACLGVHTSYVADKATVDFLTTTDQCPNILEQSYGSEGIEGFILSECPAGMKCDGTSPTEPEGLYLVKHPQTKEQLLLRYSETFNPAYIGYETDQNDFLGYVIPNLDEDVNASLIAAPDGLPNAWEAIIGLSPFRADTDCDGVSDGVELPLKGLQATNADPKNGTCAPTPAKFVLGVSHGYTPELERKITMTARNVGDASFTPAGQTFNHSLWMVGGVQALNCNTSNRTYVVRLGEQWCEDRSAVQKDAFSQFEFRVPNNYFDSPQQATLLCPLGACSAVYFDITAPPF